MHGRPRKPPKPEDAASIEKAASLRALQSQLLHHHHNKIYTEEALDLSSKLLESNPELYTGWNYRKLAVEHNLVSETDHDSIKSILDKELEIVESALRRNFKSYGAWHHRKWVLSKGLSSLDNEFELLDKFQKADSRNFHAWNYRRFVAALKNVPEKEELDQTTDMINTNFSNYSAWHNRSAILANLLKQNAQGFVSKEKVLTEEYDYVKQAIFTDPDDQSGWFYYLWLVDQTITPDAPVLVTSWPIHGSDLIVSFDWKLDGHMLAPGTSYCSETGTFPVILYFNQAVGGVNSSTVAIKFMFSKNEDLIWTPLSSNNSRKAHAWVTYLKFPDAKESLNAYPVDVSVGHSQGIISSSGSDYSVPSCFAFKVSLKSSESEHNEGAHNEAVVWKNDNFHTNEALLQNLSPILSFDQLRISEDHEPTASKWHLETIINEISYFRELSQETNCKIGKLTLARLLMAHDAMMSYNTSFAYNKVNAEEILKLFKDLMNLDPSHARYYMDEHSIVLMEKVISERKSLMELCYYYGESTSLNIHNCLCLRLTNLSLSRVGSFEHLLWVQMLDLSHNELESIEGLEALQLLSCLNLSNNKFRSFTALEPLRMLRSLKVLNISYNEIGMRMIDTTRYLCSSPLSHSIGNDFNINEYATDGVKIADYWEAVLIFRDLQLTQIDVIGNAIAEAFRLLLVKVLPRLKWLDENTDSCFRIISSEEGIPNGYGIMGLSAGEEHFIQGGIAQDLRCDGRKRLTYRPMFVETGVIPQANGSARVRMGSTDVIASVKAELGRPNSLQPTCRAGIDLSSLIVVEGKICWDLYIDGLVISSDGNLLDVLGAAIKAALSNTGIPKVNVAIGASPEDQPEVDISDEEFLQFDTSSVPVIVTLTKVGRHYIVDATSEEESQMSSAVSFSINRHGRICGLTKRGGAGLDPSVILDMISVAKHVSEQLITELDSVISAAEAES